ncbi:hypothetical protein BWP24_00785 [Vibrio campbellii]|nr:hypothetical protein BWP24_00785 [Vibrio campbellii]
MSNDKGGEKPPRRKTKGSCPTLIGAGKSTPKARPKGVVDGKRVNIPVLLTIAMGDGEARWAWRRLSRFKCVG